MSKSTAAANLHPAVAVANLAKMDKKKKIVGTTLGGLVLVGTVLNAFHEKETATASVQHRSLKEIGITMPVVYDATFTTNVGAKATIHNPNPVPVINKLIKDVRNHTVKDKADVITNIGTKLKSLKAVPDPKTGVLTIKLHGDPDPKKSDLVLQEAIDPATEKSSSQGNFGDSLMNNLFSNVKAVSQAVGKDFVSPADNTDSLLRKLDHEIMYDAVSSGKNNCANLAIRELNKENTQKVYDFADPHAPKTLKQAIAEVVFQTYASQYKTVLKPTDINVVFDLNPEGLPNPFHSGLVAARKAGSEEHVDLQSPDSYPPCTNDLKGTH